MTCKNIVIFLDYFLTVTFYVRLSLNQVQNADSSQRRPGLTYNSSICVLTTFLITISHICTVYNIAIYIYDILSSGRQAQYTVWYKRYSVFQYTKKRHLKIVSRYCSNNNLKFFYCYSSFPHFLSWVSSNMITIRTRAIFVCVFKLFFFLHFLGKHFFSTAF